MSIINKYTLKYEHKNVCICQHTHTHTHTNIHTQLHTHSYTHTHTHTNFKQTIIMVNGWQIIHNHTHTHTHRHRHTHTQTHTHTYTRTHTLLHKQTNTHTPHTQAHIHKNNTHSCQNEQTLNLIWKVPLVLMGGWCALGEPPPPLLLLQLLQPLLLLLRAGAAGFYPFINLGKILDEGVGSSLSREWEWCPERERDASSCAWTCRGAERLRLCLVPHSTKNKGSTISQAAQMVLIYMCVVSMYVGWSHLISIVWLWGCVMSVCLWSG